MIEKDIMSEEAFNEIVEGFELVEKLTPYGRKNLKYHIKRLQRENQELKNQQKEFIEWLEDKLNICDGFLDTIKSDLEEISYAGRVSGKTYIATQMMKNETGRKCYGEVLQKYKEIIGGKDEENM